ncbi:MAG TPA: VWA domain-containing protein [Thermoanaerobaculia bacterium]|nr:VWA domain-containing protein [Thermoanaerobaculia bacterium]
MRAFRIPIALLFLALLVPGLAAPAAAKDEKKITRAERKEMRAAAAKLPEKYRQWLEEVDPIITDDELKTFLALEKDYQRDAFIKRFWEVRDPLKGTARNEFQDRYMAFVQEARSRYGNLEDDRAHVLLLNGAPAVVVPSTCSTLLWPLEVWYFQGSDRLHEEFFVVFYRKWGAGLYRIWNPLEGLDTLFSDTGAETDPTQQHSLAEIANGCRDGDKLAAGIAWVANQRMGYTTIQSRIESKPDGPGGEWVSSFGAYSTDVPEGAAQINAKLDVDFPGRYQNRTVIQGLLSVPVAEAGLAKLGEHRSYDFLVNGEILQNGELFDNFRYRFDFPGSEEAAPADSPTLPLIFQRYLRPGDYTMILRLEDINSGKLFRAERTLTVPTLTGAEVLPPPQTPEEKESARMLAEADRAISNGETTLKLLRPPGDLQAGMLRFDTMATGDIASVTFSLDGKPVLTKKKPPYSVELDLGSLPRPRRLTATAFDVGGKQIASDELLVNSSGHRFRVRLVDPQRGQHYENSLRAHVETEVPDGEALDRIEIFLNETPVATLYQPPFVQPIVLPKSEEIAYVRAVGYLTDGNSTEDLVFINAPDNLEEVNVDFVELYTSVFDRGGHPVEGMEKKDFTVTEDGTRQEIARFEKVTDLPIHATVALDISASMEGALNQAQQAALQFLQETVRPKDRAAVVLFNDRPTLTTKFTNDQTALAGGLAGIKAERGTALYDTIVFTLYYNNGIKGQRAVLILSDGKDEGSRFTYEDALEYARRAGVTIYTIGLGSDIDKKKMEKIAEETGGRFFQVESATQLSGIYATIQKELRSQYLIAYQSTNTTGSTDFRTVDLKVVNKSGLEAKTMRGYYP